MSTALIFGCITDAAASAQVISGTAAASASTVATVAAASGFPAQASAVPAASRSSVSQSAYSTVANSGDYATDAFGDAWDFNNAQDLTPMMTGLSVGTTGLHLQRLSATNSVLAGTVAPGSYLMLSGTAPHVLPWGRDPRLFPIDANRYNQLTISMYSPAAMSAGAFYLTCIDGPSSCYNGSPFQVKAGWNKYTINLAKATTYHPERPRWSGQGGMMRIGFNPGSALAVQIDWIRLGTSTTAPVDPTQRQPIAVPAKSGGADYATTVRGRAWNLTGPGDVVLGGIGNVTYSAAGVRGRNVVTPSTPRGNDPHLDLPVPQPINGSIYNRMTISACYDGKFALTSVPGGGMNGRIIYQIAGESFPRNSQDFLVFPGCQTITLNLSGSAAAVEDETDARLPGGIRGFAGHSIVKIRFDPDEDPGSRYFRVSSIRLTTGGAPVRTVVPVPADGKFVVDTTTKAVYTMTGGAPVYVSNWAVFGGAKPTIAVPHEQLATWPVYPRNGTFVRARGSAGAVYRIVGGAPVYVSSWAPFGGGRPAVPIDPAAVARAGTGSFWNHLAALPANGSFVRTPGTGAVYRIAGGAPLYVPSWSAFGGQKPVVDIDPQAVVHGGQAGLWSHLKMYPVTTTYLQGAGSAAIYQVVNGRATHLLSWSTVGGVKPFTVVHPLAITRAGTGGYYNHLKR